MCVCVNLGPSFTNGRWSVKTKKKNKISTIYQLVLWVILIKIHALEFIIKVLLFTNWFINYEVLIYNDQHFDLTCKR